MTPTVSCSSCWANGLLTYFTICLMLHLTTLVGTKLGMDASSCLNYSKLIVICKEGLVTSVWNYIECPNSRISSLKCTKVREKINIKMVFQVLGTALRCFWSRIITSTARSTTSWRIIPSMKTEWWAIPFCFCVTWRHFTIQRCSFQYGNCW